MAEPLPAALKIPEVSRFVNRANQLRSIKPAISYWCEYRAVNQIVGKSLHTTGDDAFAYTKTLIDRLEATKVEHADDDSIVDNDAAKAYVEQFAQQTFDRAERTLRANKVTRQTADTFDAAATFFDLLREWGEPEPEILQKIKFAKWNAARILKAIREGKDPNESNPKQEEEQEAGAQDAAAGLQLDPNDPDVQHITSGPPPQPASVQEVPDAGEPLPDAGHPPPTPLAEEYFPQAPPSPSIARPSQSTEIPSVPPSVPEGPPSTSPQIPPQPSPQIPKEPPSQFSPPPVSPPPTAPSAGSPWTAPSAAQSASQAPAVPPQQPSAPSFIRPTPAPAPTAAPAPATPSDMDYDDLNKAQKHAKWAISALNFEDVPTAVQELRNALAALGVQ